MKKVIIVGGGIAGLSAGCYLQMNGYDTQIFEMHNPGGLCTAWKRKDYLIDGCLHWLVGTNPKSSMHRIWDELIDIDHMPRASYKEFCSYEKDGKVLRQFGDIKKLQKELERISPQDKKIIQEMINGIKDFSAMDDIDFENLGTSARSVVKMLPVILHIKRWAMPVKKYAKKFKSPFIRDWMNASFGDIPMGIFLMNASWFNDNNTGYPQGGAAEVISRLMKRYKTLGGQIHASSKVVKILTENDNAAGVELENKKVYKAGIVVSAADGRDTVFNMLGGKYLDRKTKDLYTNKKYEPKTSGFYISMGVARSFPDTFKPYVFFPVQKPLIIDKTTIRFLGVTIHNFDPKAAPSGKTVLTTLVTSNDPKYWIKLREKDPEKYESEKKKIAMQVIDEVDRHFGNIKNKLEVWDVTTPATYVRFTNNWNGALMGWTDPSLFIFQPKKTIDGLHSFYMCGQWTGGAGLPGASQSGKQVAKMICEKDKKKFLTKSSSQVPRNFYTA